MFSAALEMVLTVAYREAVSRRHANLTLEHLLFALAHDPAGEEILTACGVDVQRLKTDLRHHLEEYAEVLPKGSTDEPAQTLAFRRVLQAAVLHVQSAGRDEAKVGDVLAALLQQPKTRAAQFLAAQGVTRLDVLNYISHGVSKVPRAAPDNGPAPAGIGDEDAPRPRRDPLLAFAVNLTEAARQGKLDPLIGRAAETQRALEVLCRRRKNNPVFVGESGVGKTALVEGLAQRLLAEDVPEILKGAEVFGLDAGALLAGTRFRGDFEERFKELMAALSQRPKPILFIDELHTMVGAGATTGGTMDLANLIKPILSEGSIRILGSSTFEEYKHIEKDRALARRLQKIAVDEPSFADTVSILKGLRPRYEEHHRATYTDAALEAAVKLSSRHLREQRLPDSAVDVIDEAGAALRLYAAPGAVVAVDVPEVERVIARMARIPEKQASLSEKARLGGLEESLARVVFGQAEAVRTVARAIKRSRAGLGQPDRPAGCFLFSGPTGVGKTELAKQLARHLGNEFHRFDMSEFMEKHAVARLIGAPPGYVGFEQGGLLVDAVRNHPYSVVLLDEIEKAHPDLFNILLQVMDHATLTDNNGRKADFRQVVLIMTSNAGSREMSVKAIGFAPDRAKDAKSRGKQALERLFSPEFRNRLDAIVAFSHLSPEVMETIVEKFVLELEAQLAERRVAITLMPEARAYLARKGYDPVYGARPLARIIQAELRDPLTEEILFGKLEGGGTVTLGLAGDKLSFSVEPRGHPGQSPGLTVFRLDERLLFPAADRADENGLLAVGGDLRPERLVLAYSLGIFPWYSREPILWYSPDPRMVLRPDALRVSKSLRQTLRRGAYRITLDTAFERVIEACARVKRPGQATTWITPAMRKAYGALHRRGLAHSAEAWSGDAIVGGLYGVSLGAAFFGESMFAREPDASKAAFATLVQQLAGWGITLIDCQVHTPHLARFGAALWPRALYLSALKRALRAPTRPGPWSLEA